jgi:hypothetical protein
MEMDLDMADGATGGIVRHILAFAAPEKARWLAFAAPEKARGRV